MFADFVVYNIDNLSFKKKKFRVLSGNANFVILSVEVVATDWITLMVKWWDNN
jgi:hypothetical protein